MEGYRMMVQGAEGQMRSHMMEGYRMMMQGAGGSDSEIVEERY